MGATIGIDLGTTNTVVASVRDGVASTLADKGGRRLIPSVVSFHPSGKVLVGYPALDRRLIDPENTVYSVKRLIGRPWASPEVAAACSSYGFVLREGANSSVAAVCRGELYSLPEISAFVLRHAKSIAEASLGTTVDTAVITVPANFNDPQRTATKLAGKLAGLEVLRILNEPTAAALAYGQGAGSDGRLAPHDGQRERVAVYDLGGGTFDITILELSGDVFEVLSTAGDSQLGGDDFDLVVANKIIEESLKKYRYDPRVDPTALGRIRILAESIKRTLSKDEEVRLELHDVVFDHGKPQPLAFKMSRPELEWASVAMVDRTFATCQKALESAGLTPASIDRVMLVGGSTRMPLIARKVEQFFGMPPVMRVNPDEVVALGAAVQAHSLSRGSSGVSDRSIPISKGSMHPRAAVPVDLPPDSAEPPVLPVVRPAGATKSAPHLELSSPPSLPPPTRARRGQDEDAAFEAIALPKAPPGPLVGSSERKPVRLNSGAAPLDLAAFDALTDGDAVPRPPLLIDVTPLSLSVETVGGYCDRLLDANTPVPCDRSRVFTTAQDGQTAVMVRVAQGESPKFADNVFLGELSLTGIEAQARGRVQIAVTFEIDVDGLLRVSATDVKTGQAAQAEFHPFGQLTSPADLLAMQQRQSRQSIG